MKPARKHRFVLDRESICLGIGVMLLLGYFLGEPWTYSFIKQSDLGSNPEVLAYLDVVDFPSRWWLDSPNAPGCRWYRSYFMYCWSEVWCLSR